MINACNYIRERIMTTDKVLHASVLLLKEIDCKNIFLKSTENKVILIFVTIIVTKFNRYFCVYVCSEHLTPSILVISNRYKNLG